MAPTHEEVFAAAALVVIFDACELRLQADSSEMKLTSIQCGGAVASTKMQSPRAASSSSERRRVGPLYPERPPFTRDKPPPRPEKNTMSNMKLMLGEPLLPGGGSAKKPARSSQSYMPPPRVSPPNLLQQSSRSMVSARELSKSYFEGFSRKLTAAAAFGAEARANLLGGRTRSSIEFEDAATGPTMFEAAITIANTLIGAGVLGLPYALKSAGWAGLLVMIGATVVTCFTAKMLVWSFLALDKVRPTGAPQVESYDALAEAVLGEIGGTSMKVLTVLECYGLAICYIVLHTTNWPALLNLSSDQTFLLGLDARGASAFLISALALPTLCVRPTHLSGLAVVGLAATSSMFIVAIVAPLLGGLPSPDGTSCPQLDAAVSADAVMGREGLDLSGIGLATGLSLFAFSGHATFPELYRAMPPKERPHFSTACDLGTPRDAACSDCLIACLPAWLLCLLTRC